MPPSLAGQPVLPALLALEHAARQDRLVRVPAALVLQVALVGVLAHDFAQVSQRPVGDAPELGHHPSPSVRAPRRPAGSASRCWTGRARASAVGMSPEGAHRWDRSAGTSARTGSRRPVRVWSQIRAASAITTMISTANRIDRTPSTVELVTTWPTSRASWYLARWAKKPIRGSLEKILYQLAVRVTATSQASGTAVTQAQRSQPDLIRMVVATVRATAASSWLAIPNSGNSWLMPPSGSVTPA